MYIVHYDFACSRSYRLVLLNDPLFLITIYLLLNNKHFDLGLVELQAIPYQLKPLDAIVSINMTAVLHCATTTSF